LQAKMIIAGKSLSCKQERDLSADISPSEKWKYQWVESTKF